MDELATNNSVKIDGVDYIIDGLSEYAKSQIENIRFSDEQILQLQNELAISNTARAGYLRILNSGLNESALSDA
jgi:hypothetical protein